MAEAVLGERALGEIRRDLPGGPPRAGGGLKRAAVIVGLAVAMLAAGAVGLLRQSEDPAAVFVGGLGGSPMGTASVEALQQRLRAVPGDWRSWAILSLAYVQEARVTADPSYYRRAEGAVRRSLELHPSDNFEAAIGRGALALGRHEFTEALRWGRRARDLNPFAGNTYGVIGDAQLELGRYPAAFATLQRMIDVQPDVASYSRASYVRELLGDVRGAEEAMRLAMDAAGTPEDRAFAAYHLGELAWDRGRPVAAGGWYRQAVALTPDYNPPQAGLAKAAWANGRTGAAIELYRGAVDRNPLPEYAAALGDLYASAGRFAMAERQYALVGAEERLFRAAGVNVDLEAALFHADHGSPRKALMAARAEWRRRESVHVADALAWALYRNERYAAASRFSAIALGLGTRNALFHFHSGMIELALGNELDGLGQIRTAVEINPHFSIQHSPVAARLLEAAR